MKLSRVALRNLILRFQDVESDKGMLTIDGEIEVGAPIFIGEDPAADGEYVIAEDIIVVADGKISEIKPKEEEKPAEEEAPAEAPAEEVAAEEEAPAEEMPEEMPEGEPFVDKDARIAELEARIAELEAENAAMKEQIAAQEEQMKMSVEKLAAERKNQETKTAKKGMYAALKH